MFDQQAHPRRKATHVGDWTWLRHDAYLHGLLGMLLEKWAYEFELREQKRLMTGWLKDRPTTLRRDASLANHSLVAMSKFRCRNNALIWKPNIVIKRRRQSQCKEAELAQRYLIVITAYLRLCTS